MGISRQIFSGVFFVRFQKEVPDFNALERELKMLQEHLQPLGSPVVFSHNDLLCNNIVYNKEKGKYCPPPPPPLLYTTSQPRPAMATIPPLPYIVQYRHLIPAPVNQTSASAWWCKHPWITCQKNKPSTSMTHVACKSKLRSVVRSGHPCIHAQETGCQLGVQSCIMPGLPMHFVQELNVGTVEFYCHISNTLYSTHFSQIL